MVEVNSANEVEGGDDGEGEQFVVYLRDGTIAVVLSSSREQSDET